MSRILIDNEWYEQLAPTTLLESEYERIILQKASILFPAYHMVRFKTLVCDEEGSTRADLALIEKKYRDWWVVEVESGQHSLESHVLPQVKTLANASYSGEEVAQALLSESILLDPIAIHTMLRGKSPRVLVVVNEQKAEWALALGRYNALVTVVEVFRSSRNKHVFRVNGDQPAPVADVISEFHVDPLMRSWLVVESPAGLGNSILDKVLLRYENKLIECRCIISGDTVWLSPRGNSPFSSKTTYEILRSSDEVLTVRAKSKLTARRA